MINFKAQIVTIGCIVFNVGRSKMMKLQKHKRVNGNLLLWGYYILGEEVQYHWMAVCDKEKMSIANSRPATKTGDRANVYVQEDFSPKTQGVV